LALSS